MVDVKSKMKKEKRRRQRKKKFIGVQLLLFSAHTLDYLEEDDIMLPTLSWKIIFNR